MGAVQQLVVRLESLCDAIADAAAPPEAPRRRTAAEIEALLAETAGPQPAWTPAPDDAGAPAAAPEPAGIVAVLLICFDPPTRTVDQSS